MSAIDSPESEHGVDGVIRQLVAQPLKDCVRSISDIDLEAIDVMRLIPCGDRLLLNKGYVAGITKALELAESARSWMWTLYAVGQVEDAFGQAEDWKLLEKVLSEVDQMPFKQINADGLVDVNMLKSERGKNLANQIVQRIKQFAESNDDTVLAFFAVGIAILFFVIILYFACL